MRALGSKPPAAATTLHTGVTLLVRIIRKVAIAFRLCLSEPYRVGGLPRIGNAPFESSTGDNVLQILHFRQYLGFC